VGAWDWDVVNDRITWSEQIYEFYGVRRGEFDGRIATFQRFVHPEDWERVGKLIQRSLSKLEPYIAELRIVRPSGEIRWHSAHAKVIGDENGRATRLIGACVDITARKRAEELGKAQNRVLEMIARNEPLEQVLNTVAQSMEMHYAQMKCGIFLLDSWGHHFERGFGPSLPPSFVEAVIRNGTESRKPAQQWAAELLDIDHANGAVEAQRWTLWLRQLAGDFSFARCQVAPVTAPGGNCLGAFVMYWNGAAGVRAKPRLLAETATHLTSIAVERMRAEEQLRKRTERSQLLRDSLAELLAAKDPGVVMRNLFPKVASHLGADIYYNFLVNEQGDALKLVSFAGITPELEKHFRRVEFGKGICGTVAQLRQPIIANDIQNSTYDKAADARKIGVQTYACYPLIVEGRVLGTLSFASRTRKSYQEDELEFIRAVAQHTAVALDRQRTAQDLQKAEQKLRRHADELELRVQERTAKLQEAIAQMEEFSYTVSHDLRAPVRAISGYADVLREDYSEGMRPEARVFLERIISSSTRMDRLILDILTYTRLSRREFELQAVSLDKLLRDIIQQYPEIGASEARIIVEPDLGNVIGHEPSLSQAVSNLLTNSVKFVAPGRVPRVRVWSERRENQVRLWVEDNGIGIMPAHQKRLFTMFERVHSGDSYEGTGVGLAIVRKAAERMGGKVGVESDGVSGSRFWVELAAVGNNGK
jgi:PAS domain S-box-containing protein